MTFKNLTLKIFTLLLITVFLLGTKLSYANEDKNTDTDVFIKRGDTNKKVIALTFDDGPHPKETDQVLDVLNKNNVKATFFIAGKHAKWYPKPLIRANKEGHEIGNHTFNHPDISTLSEQQIVDEIKQCEKTIEDVIGVKTNIFRPPYGSYNKSSLEKIAKENGYKIVLWTTIDTRDWQNPSAEYIADKIINNSKNGDIILLHDYATNSTVEALEILIPKMKEMGYEFVTISELAD